MDDIYFDRLEDLPNDRAYTRIDFNRAIVGNRWIERTFSGFFGTTNCLHKKGQETEWVIAQNPEFSLQVNGATITPLDLGEVDISDECSDLGATLRVIKSGAGVEVTIETTALHDVPALIRTVSVTNRGADTIQLDSVTSEILAWEPEDIVLLSKQFREVQTDAYLCGADDVCIAAMMDKHGMLLGVLGEAELHLHAPESNQCQLVWPCEKTLAPMETWTANESYLIPCESDPFDTYRLQHSQMITQLKLATRRTDQVRKKLEEES